MINLETFDGVLSLTYKEMNQVIEHLGITNVEDFLDNYTYDDTEYIHERLGLGVLVGVAES